MSVQLDVDTLIVELQKVQHQGHGKLPVCMMVHNSSERLWLPATSLESGTFAQYERLSNGGVGISEHQSDYLLLTPDLG